jgi:hypothetical protein
MNDTTSTRVHRLAFIALMAGTAMTNVGAQAVQLSPQAPVAEVRVPEAEPISKVSMQSVAVAAPAIATETAEPEWRPALRVGEATQGLLAMQSSGISASSVQRPITGDLAARSYPRYLKSFEFPIPQTFNATIKNAGTSNSQ